MSHSIRNGLIFLVVLAITWIAIPITYRLEKLPEKVKATQNEKQYNKELALKIATYAFGYSKPERKCLVKLWNHESKFDTFARPLDSKGKPRSTAFGIAQILGERSRDPVIQISRGLRYLEHRHRGSACRALAFHRHHNYY